ncbi:MAG: DUF2508 domain-containing protein [Bacillaceae bacterium]|nr:DUF2508 domain-containing protein [Bacillaceae bacterium]
MSFATGEEMPVSREELTRAREALSRALNHFNWVEPGDPLMVDAVIYEYNAALARYRSLLRRTKSCPERAGEDLFSELERVQVNE